MGHFKGILKKFFWVILRELLWGIFKENLMNYFEIFRKLYGPF